LAGNFAAQARREGASVEVLREQRLAKHPAHRFGRPEEFGAACAFLCSAHAGYINGQNLLMDGGSFSGAW
jgi:3-oxoacyl-[acyl-carrier protein] reductase